MKIKNKNLKFLEFYLEPQSLKTTNPLKMKILLNETSVEFLEFEVILKIFQTSISMYLF